MSKRHQHEEEHENHERWLVSYADFITLLFAFFVVMYAVSRVDHKKMIEVVNSIKFAMHVKGKGADSAAIPLSDGPSSSGGCIANMGSDQRPTPEEMRVIASARKKLEESLRSFLMKKPEQAPSVVIMTEGRKLIIRLSAAHFFDPSQAAIRPEMIPVLDTIAGELGPLKRPVRIEGHTDDSPIGGTKFRDNWELSASRAAAVVSYLQKGHRIDGKLLGAAGYSSTRPVTNNSSQAGRETNRRVEMVVEVKGTEGLDVLSQP